MKDAGTLTSSAVPVNAGEDGKQTWHRIYSRATAVKKMNCSGHMPADKTGRIGILIIITRLHPKGLCRADSMLAQRKPFIRNVCCNKAGARVDEYSADTLAVKVGQIFSISFGVIRPIQIQKKRVVRHDAGGFLNALRNRAAAQRKARLLPLLEHAGQWMLTQHRRNL